MPVDPGESRVPVWTGRIVMLKCVEITARDKKCGCVSRQIRECKQAVSGLLEYHDCHGCLGLSTLVLAWMEAEKVRFYPLQRLCECDCIT